MAMLSAKSKHWLRDQFGTRVRFDEPMHRHTSFRIGGPADAYVTPHSIDELETLAAWALDMQVPFMVIGRGTNLLVRDGGIRGLVIGLGEGLHAIETQTVETDRVVVTAMAGARLPTLCAYAIERGYAGLNFAVGIPGSVGGAIQMNAGTAHGCVADVLSWVEVLRPPKALQRIPRDALEFSYRALQWPPPATNGPRPAPVIVVGGFELSKGDRDTLAQEAAQRQADRKAHQPVASASAGCMFKNPAGKRPAGQLIDQAGLKGLTIGGAAVSDLHANYIVTAAKATAADVQALIETVQQRVFETFETHLDIEVHIVGEEKNTS
jgi:UDP-N-acetylmuramate dehydrogenase